MVKQHNPIYLQYWASNTAGPEDETSDITNVLHTDVKSPSNWTAHPKTNQTHYA